jgi:antirestriction protein ArdC
MKKTNTKESAMKALFDILVSQGQFDEASKIAQFMDNKPKTVEKPKSKFKAKTPTKKERKKMTKEELEIKVYTDISNDIIAELERVIALGNDKAIKWVRTWATAEPQNVITHTPYRGFNWLYLSMTGHTYLITAKQLHDWNVQKFGEDHKEQWARLKEGYKRLSVTFYSPWFKKEEEKPKEEETEEGEEKTEEETVVTEEKKPKRTRFTFKVYTVYDIRDIEGFPYPEEETTRNHDAEMPMPKALFNALNKVVPVEYGYNEACYIPSLDKVHMPNKETFTGIEEFYGVQGHEYIHSTGAKGRLNRKIENEFGSKEYAEEELVAEFGGIKLANLFGFAPKIFKNTVAYLRSWIKALKDDVKALYWASTKADKAVEWIVKYYNENKEPNEPRINLESVKELETKEKEEEKKEEPTTSFDPKTQTVTMSAEEYQKMMSLVALLS